MPSSKKKPASGKTSPWLNQPSDAMSLHSQGAATTTTTTTTPSSSTTPSNSKSNSKSKSNPNSNPNSNSNSTTNSIAHRYRDDFSDHDHDMPDDPYDSDSSMSFVADEPCSAAAVMDDPPPMYTDDPAAIAAAINPLLPASAQPGSGGGMHLPVPTRTDSEGNETFVDRRLDSDPVYLEHTITHLALFPPRPYARVVGTHTETSTRSSSSSSSHNHNGRSGNESRTETSTVTDFDVRVDLTPFLYRNINRHEAWRTVRPVGNFDKVRRGTVFATRAPGYGGSGPRLSFEEGGGDVVPSLREWCHRYCASPRRLRNMLIRRRVTGLDEDLLKSKLTTLVRATQYRGQLDVSFPLHAERVDVRSDVWEHRWASTRWIRWIFYLTFLWLFSWPYLFLRAVCFETVTIDWAFSRPRDPILRAAAGNDDPSRPPRPGVEREFVTIGEEAWYNMWARAIQRAVLERRQCELDQGDLRAAEAAEPTFADSLAAGRGGGSTGDFVRAGMNAMNIVNRQFGWGHNR